MLLFGDRNKGWTLETDRTGIRPATKNNVLKYIEKIGNGEMQFLILNPPVKIEKSSYLQVCGDEYGYHVEICFPNDHGFDLLGKDHVMKDEVKDLFMAYFLKMEIPDVSDWYPVMPV